jgi:hypothetical protein
VQVLVKEFLRYCFLLLFVFFCKKETQSGAKRFKKNSLQRVSSLEYAHFVNAVDLARIFFANLILSETDYIKFLVPIGATPGHSVRLQETS